MHDKTYNKTFVNSKYSDKPVRPPSMARVLGYPSLGSPDAVEGTCSQQRLIRLHGMRSQILVFTGHTSLIACFVVHWLIYQNMTYMINLIKNIFYSNPELQYM